jgi:hypothetical protein
MFKNHNVSSARANNTPAKGVREPSANMPANNVGTFPVSKGTTHSSKFGTGVKPATQQKGSTQVGKGSSKANTPANNITDTKLPLGTTKHGVGEVPGYLKAKY